jgi:hypothetical protein
VLRHERRDVVHLKQLAAVNPGENMPKLACQLW